MQSDDLESGDVKWNAPSDPIVVARDYRSLRPAPELLGVAAVIAQPGRRRGIAPTAASLAGGSNGISRIRKLSCEVLLGDTRGSSWTPP